MAWEGVQVGIDSGFAIAGVIGHKTFQYDLCGDAVNTAARMCSYSEPGRVHISERTYALVRHRFGSELCGEREIKGKGRMRTYFLNNAPPTRQELSEAGATSSSLTHAAASTGSALETSVRELLGGEAASSSPSDAAASRFLAAPAQPTASPQRPLRNVANQSNSRRSSLRHDCGGGLSSRRNLLEPSPRRTPEEQASADEERREKNEVNELTAPDPAVLKDKPGREVTPRASSPRASKAQTAMRADAAVPARAAVPEGGSTRNLKADTEESPKGVLEQGTAEAPVARDHEVELQPLEA